jgi:hypothetical protein
MRRKGKSRVRWIVDDEEDLRYMGVKRWKRKSCGQNRMGVCRKGRQGQTQRAVVLQKTKVLLRFGQGNFGFTIY